MIQAQIKSKFIQRKKAFTILLGVIVLALVTSIAYWIIHGSRYLSTDNAYTAVELAQVTPEIDGTVKEVVVIDTQSVRTGDILVEIDDRDLKIAHNQALAEEKKAKSIALSAKADLNRANIDFSRRKSLAGSGSVSGDELTHAENALLSAQAAQAAADAGISEAEARVQKTSLDLERTTIKSPVTGVVAKRQVQIGQRIRSGAPLMVIVPVQEIHVDANFKEGQLDKVRQGQAVELTSDLYGGGVVYHGIVDGFSGGTGSAFATIPAQNATGNWIKVVQRIPVRIKMDPRELTDKPLSVGLSMTATVDTRSK